MSATLNERISSTPTTIPGVTRVAIREVREAAFRALVANGASNAEAKVAAEQVLFTELHRGSGLVALLEDLASGPWVQTGLACTRDASGEQPVLQVTGPHRSGALRQGALLLDLLAAEAKPSLVVSGGLTSLSPLLDEPLGRVASTLDCWVVAADRSAESLDFRVASPDGSIGVGTTAPSHSQSGQTDVPLGVSLGRRQLRPEWDITWLTATEQRSTRAAAAQHGLLVDAAVWAEVKTAADAYLVPEQ